MKQLVFLVGVLAMVMVGCEKDESNDSGTPNGGGPIDLPTTPGIHLSDDGGYERNNVEGVMNLIQYDQEFGWMANARLSIYSNQDDMAVQVALVADTMEVVNMSDMVATSYEAFITLENINVPGSNPHPG